MPGGTGRKVDEHGSKCRLMLEPTHLTWIRAVVVDAGQHSLSHLLERTIMNATGLRVFDETLHATNTWLHKVTSRMGWDDREKGRLLRLCLHTVRDRMPVGEAAHLSAQLPLLLRGVFFEGWRPAKVPLPVQTVEEFLAPLQKGFASERHFDAEAAFREVVDVMRMHVSAGEMEDVRRVMPDESKRLWAEERLGPPADGSA